MIPKQPAMAIKDYLAEIKKFGRYVIENAGINSKYLITVVVITKRK
jgi:hypothetical protein